MAGLVPAIPVFAASKKQDVDAAPAWRVMNCGCQARRASTASVDPGIEPILRSEYLHVDVGTVTNTLNLDPANCSDSPCGASWSHGSRYDIGRVGLSYKFGG